VNRTALHSPPATRYPPLVFDDHNCEYLLQQRNALADLRLPQRWLAAAYSLVQWQKLRYYEAQICRQATATLAVSEADKAALAAIAPDRPITVIPNGIYLADYPLVATDVSSPPYTLLFTGKMDYRPNIDAMLWFGRHVLPLILAVEPQARLQIVGLSPHPRLAELRQHPAIEITGAVPDIRPYLQQAAVYIIPMRVGGGTRFKALEAMATGKGIVSTPLGVEGIAVRHEAELLLADSPEAFAAAVLRLLRDQQQGGLLTQQLGRRARAFVEVHYSWTKIAPQLEQLYGQLTS
jgi:glycosyltransferase involved in cell wall biosynthesis